MKNGRNHGTSTPGDGNHFTGGICVSESGKRRVEPETGLASGTGTSEQEETLWGVLGAAGRGTDEPVETHV